MTLYDVIEIVKQSALATPHGPARRRVRGRVAH
jgi:hypothetical protein